MGLPELMFGHKCTRTPNPPISYTAYGHGMEGNGWCKAHVSQSSSFSSSLSPIPRPESRVVVNGYTFSRDRDDTATFLIGRSNTNFLDNTVTGRDTYIYILYVLYADRRITDDISVGVELKVDVPSSDGKQQMNSTLITVI